MRTRAKEKLCNDGVVTFVNPDYPSPGMVEFLGAAGADAVFLCAEHGNADFERIEDMARAARLTGTAAIVRPMSHDPALITRYLNRNIDGVIIPHVDTAAQAEAIVETVRYARWNDYEDRIVVSQVESLESVQNLPELLKVDGIDVFFIGPADLSQAMGHPGNAGHPEVEDTIQRVLAATLEAGRVAGILVNPENTAERVAQGFRLLYEHANTFVKRGLATFMEVAEASRPR